MQTSNSPENFSEVISQAFHSLSNADLIAIRKSAHIHMQGTALYADPSDLIHEALVRCLDGRRHWDEKVPFTVFFSNVMRSIAHADRKSFQTRKFVSASVFEQEGLPDGLGWVADRVESAEDRNIAIEREALGRKQLTELRKAFSEDWLALEIINSWGTGEQSTQITDRHGIEFNTFEAARKRVQRHIKKISIQGDAL